MTEGLPLQHVEVSFVVAPPARQVERASGVSEVETAAVTTPASLEGEVYRRAPRRSAPRSLTAVDAVALRGVPVATRRPPPRKKNSRPRHRQRPSPRKGTGCSALLKSEKQEVRLGVIGLGEVIVALIVVGGAGGTILTLAERMIGAGRKQARLEAGAAQDRVRTLEAQLVAAHRQNEQLKEQLAWHSRMLDRPTLRPEEAR